MRNLQGTHGWNRMLAYTHRTHRRKRHVTKPGVNGGLFQKQPQRQGVTQLNYITIESIDIYAEKVEKFGGKILAPIQQVFTVGCIAVAQDPEGNQFGLLQPEKT